MKSLNPNLSGSTVLVEQCPKISIDQILAEITPQIKEQLIKTKLTMQGFDVSLDITKTAFNGDRFWFKCPLCEKRSSVLYQHPLSGLFGCRSCLGLEYKSRRYKGMIEAEVMS